MRLLALKRRLLSLLAEEIKAHLPQFEPHATDYQMVVYACRDLETWMRCKWTVESQRAIYERIEEAWEYEPQDFKVFLNFWVGSWIEKWRERVKVLSKKPKLPARLQEKIERSKKIYRGMDHRKELKKMVTEKLMLQGEICMAEIIAENLIVEEITKRSRGTDKDSKPMTVDPVDIYNSLSLRISKLREEKRPLIYLNVKLYTF